jgi:hypothetical protein
MSLDQLFKPLNERRNPALGAGGRVFKSRRPDQSLTVNSDW